MSERRMFAKTIIDSDAFLEMPMSTQALYFHLSMRADDEGFINNPKKISRMLGASDDDLKLLIAKSFIIPFDSGVVVIKHWKIHNYIRGDRIKPTVYQEERAMLEVKNNESYTLCQTVGCQLADKCQTDVSIGKVSIGEDSIVKDSIESIPTPRKEKHKFGTYKNVLLTDEEQMKLVEDYGVNEAFEAVNYLSEYIEMKGAKYKSHYLALRKWVFDALKEKRGRKTYQKPSQLDELARACEELEALHGHTTDK